MLHTSLTQDAATIARIRPRPRSLSVQSGTGTLGLIMTSGVGDEENRRHGVERQDRAVQS